VKTLEDAKHYPLGVLCAHPLRPLRLNSSLLSHALRTNSRHPHATMTIVVDLYNRVLT
jgi:hypothetical protein